MNPKVTNILIVGVGGQGVVLAGEILAAVALESGFDVKKSEVHGMAQRGGVVSSHVRFGDKVYSPIIKKGAVDILVSFEEFETLRWVNYLAPQSKIIMNLQRITPPSVALGTHKYPENTVEWLRQKGYAPLVLDALGEAATLGNPRLVNILLLGVLSDFLELKVETWQRIIAEKVPPKWKDLNLVAFERGRTLGAELLQKGLAPAHKNMQ